MRRRSTSIALLAAAVLAACGGDQAGRVLDEPVSLPSEHGPSYHNARAAMGQTLYVPVYSHVYQDRQRRPFNLVGTLSIRNADLTHPIQVTSVRYYDSRGRLLRNFVDAPVTVAPVASVDYVVDEHDEHGSGTSFLVEWIAGQEVQEPVVEAVMISTILSQGLSFTSPGRVIRTLAPAKPPPATP